MFRRLIQMLNLFKIFLLLPFFLILCLLSLFHDGLKRKSMSCSNLESLLGGSIVDQDDLPQLCVTEAVNVC